MNSSSLKEDFWVAEREKPKMLLAPMSNARRGNILYRLFWSIGNNPILIVEVLQHLLLVWVLLQTLVGFGGFLAYGLPMVGVSKSLILLTALHIVLMLLRRGGPAFHWIMLVPVPLIGYALLHWLVLSPFEWNAAPQSMLYLQAYALSLVVYNSINSIRTVRWMVALLQVPLMLAVIVALLRYHVFPHWIQDGTRISDPAYDYGAGGFFQDPANLTALILLLLPLLYIFLIKYRFNMPVRMYAIAVIALLLMGMVMSSNLTGFALIPVLLAFAPLFQTERWQLRRAIWKWSLATMAVGIILVYVLMGPAFDRLSNTLLMHIDNIGQASRQVAISAFQANPLTGTGLGGYSLVWDQYTPVAEAHARHVIGGFHEILAETGLVGLLMLLASILLFLGWTIRKWRAIPYTRVDPDTAHRLKSLPRNHPLHRRVSRKKGRMSTRKAFIGGLWLGIISCLVYCAGDFAMMLPVVVFYFACCGGLMAALCRGYESQNSGRFRLVAASVPLVLACVAGSAAIRYHYANHIIFVASEKLSVLQADPEQVFHSQRDLNGIIAELELALGLVPEHGEGLTLFGTARLLQLAAELEPPETVASRALVHIESALSVYPESWESHFNAAIAYLQTGNPGKASRHLERSMELAPLRIEPRALSGSLLLLENPESPTGKEMLLEVSGRDPDLEIVGSLLRRTGIKDSEEIQQMLTAASLARQFHLLPPLPERVNAAGLRRPDEP